MEANVVIKFWFEELTTKDWWRKDPELDRSIGDKFSDTLLQAKQSELFQWREFPMGCLAEIIVLDQFSRNIFRDTKDAFAQDSLALILAQEVVRRGIDKDIPDSRKSFLYMPYMHSESKIIHEQAVELFSQPAMSGTLDFEMKHKAIIDKFGRYPHRNKILGRISTPEEVEFLGQPGSSF